MLALALIIMSASCGSDARRHAAESFSQGVSLYLKKDLAGAEAHLKKCLELDSGRRDARLLLAKIYYFQGRDDDFEQAIKRYLKCAGDSVEGMRLQARWHMRKNSIAEAKGILLRILEIADNDACTLYLLGRIYSMEGDYHNAIITFNRGFGNYSYLKQMHDGLAETYLRLGLNERARANIRMSDEIERWNRQEK